MITFNEKWKNETFEWLSKLPIYEKTNINENTKKVSKQFMKLLPKTLKERIGNSTQKILKEFYSQICDHLNELSKTKQIVYDFKNNTPEDFIADLKSLGFNVQTERINQNHFESWFNAINYEESYPKYTRTYKTTELIKKKVLEHYLSLNLLQIAQYEVGIDMGGNTAPSSQIAMKYAEFKRFYHLDLPR